MVTTGALVRDTSEGTVGARKMARRKSIMSSTIWIVLASLKGFTPAQSSGLKVQRPKLSPSTFGAKLCRNMDEYRRNVPLDLPAERLTIYSSHPQASCRVGRALDPSNKLKGSGSIYVMDASALPSNVGRNPQISVMTFARMQAEKLAFHRGFNPKPLV